MSVSVVQSKSVVPACSMFKRSVRQKQQNKENSPSHNRSLTKEQQENYPEKDPKPTTVSDQLSLSGTSYSTLRPPSTVVVHPSLSLSPS